MPNTPTTPGALIGHRKDGRPIYLAAGGAPEDGTTTTTEPAPEGAPAAFAFPFEVPADLSTATDEQLLAVLGSLREFAGTFAGLSPADTTADTIAALQATRELAVAVAAERDGRRDRSAQAAAFAADIVAATAVPDDPAPVEPPVDPEPEPVPAAAVTAARRPAPPPVRQVARTAPAPVLPADIAPVSARMTSSADAAGFVVGQNLDSFADAARVLSDRIDKYPSMTSGRALSHHGKRAVTAYHEGEGRQLIMKSFTRHAGVQIRREFPDELRVRDGQDGYAVAEYAALEKRLPGGSLLRSMQQQIKNGRSLTAAAGWCAPSEVIYDLCELETLDGILDLPEMQTSRGGWQIPIGGGPNFATIFSSIGDNGDTHLTEAEVIAEVNKVCTDIPCPPFQDVRLGVDYFCLTGGLLQRRGYPEVVARWSRGGMTALAHKINQNLISQIATASGAATVIPADPSGDDAISALLSAVHLAIVDAKYRNRMSFQSTLEVVLPMWVLVSMMAAGTRRHGVNMVPTTEQQIMDWFAERRAVPRFVYDWQDSFSGLAGGPGGASPLTALPSTVQFLVYPAGTWVKAVQDVVSLDTIYDSTRLATNEYTAVFVEDGWAPLQMCPTSRLYTVPVDVSGVVGCCAANQS